MLLEGAVRAGAAGRHNLVAADASLLVTFLRRALPFRDGFSLAQELDGDCFFSAGARHLFYGESKMRGSGHCVTKRVTCDKTIKGLQENQLVLVNGHWISRKKHEAGRKRYTTKKGTKGFDTWSEYLSLRGFHPSDISRLKRAAGDQNSATYQADRDIYDDLKTEYERFKTFTDNEDIRAWRRDPALRARRHREFLEKEHKLPYRLLPGESDSDSDTESEESESEESESETESEKSESEESESEEEEPRPPPPPRAPRVPAPAPAPPAPAPAPPAPAPPAPAPPVARRITRRAAEEGGGPPPPAAPRAPAQNTKRKRMAANNGEEQRLPPAIFKNLMASVAMRGMPGKAREQDRLYNILDALFKVHGHRVVISAPRATEIFFEAAWKVWEKVKDDPLSGVQDKKDQEAVLACFNNARQSRVFPRENW